MNDAELREFCIQMIGKFKLLADIKKEMQYETIDARFTEWELKGLIFALDVLRLTAEISNKQTDDFCSYEAKKGADDE